MNNDLKHKYLSNPDYFIWLIRRYGRMGAQCPYDLYLKLGAIDEDYVEEKKNAKKDKASDKKGK
jgi:hypothetical protein